MTVALKTWTAEGLDDRKEEGGGKKVKVTKKGRKKAGLEDRVY